MQLNQGPRPLFQLRQPAGREVECATRLKRNLCAVEPVMPGSLPDPAGALLRFRVLMRRLDRWLDQPLRAQRDARGHVVWILGAVGYRVDRHAKAVYAVIPEGRIARRADFTVDVTCCLRTSAWLEFVIRRLGLSDRGAQGHLFCNDKQIHKEEVWMASEAYRFLCADKRFHELRLVRLPRALGLDSALVGIALAARLLPARRELDSDQFSYVWRNEALFRGVARENPKLLPLVYLALLEGRIPPLDDPVELLRDLCLAHGLKQATWRFLARHGVRWLRPLWRGIAHRARTRAAIEVLRAFEQAGYPPPPPKQVLLAWADHADLPARLRDREGGSREGVPPAVLAACCAGARSGGGCVDAMRVAEIQLVFAWAAGTQPELDKLQRRAGWPWVRRQALAWERRMRLAEIAGPRSWPVPLAEHENGAFRARAIGTVDELVDIGLAFRNCIADFAGHCQQGLVQMFEIDSITRGKSVAIAALSGDPSTGRWRLLDVKGPCNAPVPDALWAFGRELKYAFREALRPPRPPPAQASTLVPAVTAGRFDLIEDVAQYRAAPARLAP